MVSMNIDKELTNKNILITGAYGNIGKYLCEIYLKYNSHIFINGKDNNKLIKLKKNLSKKYPNTKITVSCFDVISETKVENFFKKNNIDIVINNAHSSKMGDINNLTKNDFLNTFEINVFGYFNIAKQWSKYCDHKKNKCLINLSSIYGMRSPKQFIYDKKNLNSISYGSSKAAIFQLTKYLSVNLLDKKIRVNTLVLGCFPTTKYKLENPKIVKKLISFIPEKRFGKKSDLDGPIVFLSTSMSSYVSGASILVDGGWTVW